ncbi:hypothetical protein Tco_0694005 [Tanacetum coccineum]
MLRGRVCSLAEPGGDFLILEARCFSWVELGDREADPRQGGYECLLDRDLVATAGAPEATKDALVVDEGAQTDPAPVQAPQPPPPARTMPQRIARLEEDVHEIRVALGEQREVMDAMARDFSRFTVWAARGISQLLDSARAT